MCRGFAASVSLVGYFFFSSRRRHTRLQGDWSSDVCSSDLVLRRLRSQLDPGFHLSVFPLAHDDVHVLRSEERRVGKSVDLGGRRIIKKKKILSSLAHQL